MIKRYSSRRQRLNRSFLNEKLAGAVGYDRIAGYFSPSILEIAGEQLESIQGKVRMVCNSHLIFDKIALPNSEVSPVAQKNAIWSEWCSFEPEKLTVKNNAFHRLFQFIDENKIEIRILTDDLFGLIHGKAGVITYSDGTKTAFMGSANETYNAWKTNYELLWEDNSPETIAWVQEEFDALWGHQAAFPLTREVVEDIKRNADRRVVSIVEWKQQPSEAGPIIEAPVYRKYQGLWEHQKFFVHHAFHAHIHFGGARYILADEVGLGKTLQLAMAAQLMALYGEKPILIIAPKTLLWQWQTELQELLAVPSAVWDGSRWVDEYGVKYEKGNKQIKNCPRKIGLVSQGLIFAKNKSHSAQNLLDQEYECVIVDEAHRARRRFGPGQGAINERNPQRNNLLQYLREISSRTKSMLFATATPVQIHPVEAWDLLDALAVGQPNKAVFGDHFSKWSSPQQALDYVINGSPADNLEEFWQWVRNPLPPANEEDIKQRQTFQIIRSNLGLNPNDFIATQADLQTLTTPNRQRLEQIRDSFHSYNNPFIRSIIRRTRKYLEDETDPDTGKPYLDKIDIALLGEANEEALELPTYLQEAFQLAEEYCKKLRESGGGKGFMETLLLRRLGSSIEAGQKTTEKLLSRFKPEPEEEESSLDFLLEEDDDELEENQTVPEQFGEKQILENILTVLNQNEAEDPKYQKALQLLLEGQPETGPWWERGCIVFTLYYDSAFWVAGQLSRDLPDLKIGLYAGAGKSKIIENGSIHTADREEIKVMVKTGQIKVLVGTDAASEGLNLQTLGTLINLDLPWNPTKLEQRKGRIQRIGQKYPKIYIYNLRYKDSVEDKVHQALSERLAQIHEIFGQIPDTLEDVWVKAALGEIDKARKIIDAMPSQHPFDIRYKKNAKIPGNSWEKCTEVLNTVERMEVLTTSWSA